MKHKVSSEYTKQLDKSVEYLKHNDGSCFIFANSKRLIKKLRLPLEAKLDSQSVGADVIVIHGDLDKHEKMALSKFFVMKLKVPGFNPRAAMCTSAADIGIDHPKLEYVTMYEWPFSLGVYAQRRGRASRDGETSAVLLVAGLSSYIAQMEQIHMVESSADDDDVDHDNLLQSLNNTLTPKKNRRPAISSKTKYALTKMQKKHLVVRRGTDLLEVIQFFCLNNGCQHNLLEHYLSVGRYNTRPHGENDCGEFCGMCNGEWGDNFLRVRKEGVLRWFDSGEVRDTFPMKATVKNLMDLLWKKEACTNGIFDLAVSTVNKYNVEAFFLQLIGLKFIAIEKRRDNNLYWIICRERNILANDIESTRSRYAISRAHDAKKSPTVSLDMRRNMNFA